MVGRRRVGEKEEEEATKLARPPRLRLQGPRSRRLGLSMIPMGPRQVCDSVVLPEVPSPPSCPPKGGLLRARDTTGPPRATAGPPGHQGTRGARRGCGGCARPSDCAESTHHQQTRPALAQHWPSIGPAPAHLWPALLPHPEASVKLPAILIGLPKRDRTCDRQDRADQRIRSPITASADRAPAKASGNHATKRELPWAQCKSLAAEMPAA